MSKQIVPPHGNRRYPWEKWAGKPDKDGPRVTAIRGIDFRPEVSASSFRATVVKRAERMGRKVTTRVFAENGVEKVWFCFLRVEQAEQQGK